MDNIKLEDHLVEDLNKLNAHILNSYQIDQNISLADIKRGLRNSDGTGVLAGITGVGSVQGPSLPKPANSRACSTRFAAR